VNDEAVYAVLLHGERVGSLRFFDSWPDARKRNFTTDAPTPATETSTGSTIPASYT